MNNSLQQNQLRAARAAAIELQSAMYSRRQPEHGTRAYKYPEIGFLRGQVDTVVSLLKADSYPQERLLVAHGDVRLLHGQLLTRGNRNYRYRGVGPVRQLAERLLQLIAPAALRHGADRVRIRAARAALPEVLPRALHRCVAVNGRKRSGQSGCSPRQVLDKFLGRLAATPGWTNVTIFDVGANNGLFSLALLREVQRRSPSTHVALHLFEPQPHLQPQLAALTTAVGPNVTVRNIAAAASVRDGVGTFWASSRNSETASLHQTASRALHKRNFSVALVDLDAYLAAHVVPSSPPDLIFLKLDVESAEFELLPHLLRRAGAAACWIDYWLIEWHLWESNKSPDSIAIRRDFEALLARQCRGVKLAEPRAVDHDEIYSIRLDVAS